MAKLLVVNVPAVMVMVAAQVSVPPKFSTAPVALIVKEFMLTATDVVTVGVPDRESIVTSSALVGTDAPPAPPDVADQLVVVAASHVPDPPTQYLAAMDYATT